MDESNYMLRKPKTKENRHIYKLFGIQKSGSIVDDCETMEEFNEEDIWGGVSDGETNQIGLQDKGCNTVTWYQSMGIKEGSNKYSRKSLKIPRKESFYEEEHNGRTAYQSSAPVNIPDWSQMVCKEKGNENYWTRSHGMVDHDNSDDCGGDFERIPPHQLIARQLVQSETTSCSVYEGVGRTLKGRDLTQVRNAVWRRTGFIE